MLVDASSMAAAMDPILVLICSEAAETDSARVEVSVAARFIWSEIVASSEDAPVRTPVSPLILEIMA